MVLLLAASGSLFPFGFPCSFGSLRFFNPELRMALSYRWSLFRMRVSHSNRHGHILSLITVTSRFAALANPGYLSFSGVLPSIPQSTR